MCMSLVPCKEKYVCYCYKLIFWCWNLWFVRTRKNQLGCVALIFRIYLFINTCHGLTGLQCCIDDQKDWKNKVHKATLHDSTVMVFSMWTKVEDVKVLDCKKRIRREDLGFNGKTIINKVMHFMLLLLADWLARTTVSSN